MFFSPVVEDDEDDFPNTRTDGEFLHNNNGSKEKCEYCGHSFREPVNLFLNVFLSRSLKKYLISGCDITCHLELSKLFVKILKNNLYQKLLTCI